MPQAQYTGRGLDQSKWDGVEVYSDILYIHRLCLFWGFKGLKNAYFWRKGSLCVDILGFHFQSRLFLEDPF